jgi:predicted phage baseplate assembly protein
MLPVPNLDDRTFQDLVDEARAHIRRTFPTWSDHNISDPGITLIETFAMMVEQLIYRLNRVPDLHYVKFLELLGVELAQPGAATGDATFYLSAPRPDNVAVPKGTQVSTAQTESEGPIVFQTSEELTIVPCSMRGGSIFTRPFKAEPEKATPVERVNDPDGVGFDCFSPTPVPRDEMLIGLSNEVPSCAIQLDVVCIVRGVGAAPEAALPPYEWFAWCGPTDGWVRCAVEHDSTGALNRTGRIVLHVPTGHVTAALPDVSARRGWLKCAVSQPRPDLTRYDQSPHVISISATTIGGTAAIIHADVTHDELLGVSDGSPGQRFKLANSPVVRPGSDCTVQVKTVDGRVETWKGVRHFSNEPSNAQCFHIEPVPGEVVFGPAVRGPRGEVIQCGAVPPAKAQLRVSRYLTRGGQAGNVGVGRIRVLKSSVPYVSRVANRQATTGGRAAETIEEVKVRAPLLLHARDRAVTARDFKQLAREALGEIGRVECLTADEDNWGTVRLLVVPSLQLTDSLEIADRGDLDFAKPQLDRIRDYLGDRTLAGTNLVVKMPNYKGLTIAAKVNRLPGFTVEEVEANIERELHRLLHPLVGGPEGTGWPLGRTVRKHEVLARFPWIAGVDNTQSIQLEFYSAEWDGTRYVISNDEIDEELEVGPTELVFSFKHAGRVRQS